jgi:hypothetical protein
MWDYSVFFIPTVHRDHIIQRLYWIRYLYSGISWLTSRKAFLRLCSNANSLPLYSVPLLTLQYIPLTHKAYRYSFEKRPNGQNVRNILSLDTVWYLAVWYLYRYYFSEDILELKESAAELNWDLEIVNKKMTMRWWSFLIHQLQPLFFLSVPVSHSYPPQCRRSVHICQIE